jgi:hypothetical protein
MATTRPSTEAGVPAARAGTPRAPLAVGATVAVGVVVVALHDPHVSGSYGICPLVALTGLWCPMCGGLRATHDLARGDVAGAWGMNPLWVLIAPLLVLAWSRWFVAARRGRPVPSLPSAAPWILLGAVLLFGVLRNLPALAPYLAP